MSRWSPTSRVNANHLLQILRRGDPKYRAFIREVLTDIDDEGTFAPREQIKSGIHAGYLPSDAMATLYPTPENITEVKEAAAQDALYIMVMNLLALDQDATIKILVKTGQVTQAMADKCAAEWNNGK